MNFFCRSFMTVITFYLLMISYPQEVLGRSSDFNLMDSTERFSDEAIKEKHDLIEFFRNKRQFIKQNEISFIMLHSRGESHRIDIAENNWNFLIKDLGLHTENIFREMNFYLMYFDSRARQQWKNFIGEAEKFRNGRLLIRLNPFIKVPPMKWFRSLKISLYLIDPDLNYYRLSTEDVVEYFYPSGELLMSELSSLLADHPLDFNIELNLILDNKDLSDFKMGIIMEELKGRDHSGHVINF